MTLTFKITLKPGSRRPHQTRVADLLEVHAQELRDEADGGIIVSLPEYALMLNGDTLEVGYELP